MNLTAAQLLRIAPAVGTRAAEYAGALNAAMSRFNIDTPKRAAHFLAQVVHESGELSRVRENLNYSAASLIRTWPKRFPSMAAAVPFARNPEMIANFVYANRMGNGNEQSRDGWRYRGAGWIQLTGKDNHFAVARELAVIGDIGEWLSTVTGAALSAAWFWHRAGCNRLADVGDVDGISDLINIGRQTDKVGDAIGYPERLRLTRLCLEVLS